MDWFLYDRDLSHEIVEASTTIFKVGNFSENVTTTNNLLWISKAYLGLYETFMLKLFLAFSQKT